jgi:ubiquinone/menaquinone biosynthesis C-methylase UbiE
MSKGLQQTWNKRVDTWHDHVTSAPIFEAVREEIFRLARPNPQDRCVDLGAGTGFITLPLARKTHHVTGVDLSPAMAADLAQRAEAQKLTNVATMVEDLATVRFPGGSIDLAVSNHALHHLPHPDKQQVLARAFDWLRPGGRLVVADLMFGRSLNANDRQVLAAKAKMFARLGPGGVWRIAKNVTRLGLGIGQERPAPPGFWMRAFYSAGFVGVEHVQVQREAHIVWGRRPA